MLIAGVDEVGRGPLAGPVVAAAVIIESGDFPDSKIISAKKRLELYEIILSNALAVGVCAVPPFLIDSLNIRIASLLAMKQAVLSLSIIPDFVIVDGRDEIPQLNIPQKSIIGGDGKEFAIGAASIVAKVSRDLLMKSYNSIYTQYHFAKNKGYPTKEHYSDIGKFGITILHRKSFRLR
ncbi:ribonuclease HII [bacterium]|nr:ribonuclease HII [bacterium]